MITRKDYLEGRATHDDYYMDVLQAMPGKPALPADLETIREKLKTDSALNNIPLHRWGGLIGMFGADKALRERGDYLTLAGIVCLQKAWAKHLAERK
jgi:hypothetical protein